MSTNNEYFLKHEQICFIQQKVFTKKPKSQLSLNLCGNGGCILVRILSIKRNARSCRNTQTRSSGYQVNREDERVKVMQF